VLQTVVEDVTSRIPGSEYVPEPESE